MRRFPATRSTTRPNVTDSCSNTGDPVAVGDPLAEIDRRADLAGIVIGLTAGLPDRRRLDIVETALRRGLRAWLYWPAEQAVECVDRERLQSLRRHRHAVIALEKVGRRAHRVMKSWQRVKPGLRWIYRGAFPVRRFDMLADLERLSLDARPVPFPGSSGGRTRSRRIDAGLYLRTDFWAPITSGGSYGHTCYVAKELSAVTGRFVCLLAQPFKLLDELGVPQVVMDAPTTIVNEDAIVSATTHYYPIVKTACEVLRPAYIYERLCLGNYVAALAEPRAADSRTSSNTTAPRSRCSEASTGRAPFYADVYLKAEEVAFRQATLISVISEHVKTDLLSRGVDARKILVNPNGADLDSYAPAAREEQARDPSRASASPTAIG